MKQRAIIFDLISGFLVTYNQLFRGKLKKVTDTKFVSPTMQAWKRGMNLSFRSYCHQCHCSHTLITQFGDTSIFIECLLESAETVELLVTLRGVCGHENGVIPVSFALWFECAKCQTLLSRRITWAHVLTNLYHCHYQTF